MRKAETSALSRGARRLIGPIVDSLRSFQGNARACILVEPLWGISYYLFVPYASLYMLALGVEERQIGTIAALGMALQTFWSLAGGWITDRLGRRRTSLIFDTLSWSLPTLIWAFADGFTWFLAAAMLNSLVRVVHISWSCLFIEDAAPESRVRLYAWISVAGTLSGFFAPIAGLLVGRFGLVPATRGLYLMAFVMMTAMFWLRNALTKETAVGLVKMSESRGKSLRGAFDGYMAVLRALVGSRVAIIAFLLAVLSNIHLMVRNNFLSVVLTKGIGLPASLIAAFSPLASAVTLVAYFLLVPRVKNIRRSLVLAMAANIAGNLLLLFAPQGSVLAVVAGTFAVALGMGVAGPVVDAVLANSVEDSTRATALSIIYTLMFAITAPFGWIAGQVAAAGPRLPALLAALTMAASAVLALSVERKE
ncbi:MAG: MFS transporter [Spirochaetaceae bacterium]|nr:MFS transporter [Spirochaetaceae bacterium]